MASKRVVYLVVATLLLLPSYIFRFSLGPIKTNGLDVVLTVASLLLLVELKKQKVTLRFGPALIWLSLLLLAGALGVLVSPTKLLSLGAYKSWFVLPGLFTVLLAQFSLRRNDFEKVTWAFVTTGAVAALIAVYDYITQKGWIDYQGINRAVGYFTQPNYLALFIIIPLVISVLFCVTSYGKRTFWLAVPVTALQLTALLLTYSRAGYLALGLGLLWGILVLYGFRKALLSVVALGAIFICLYAAIPQIQTRFHSTFDFQDQTTTRVRKEIDDTTLRMLKAHPVFGIGLDAYQIAYDNYKLPEALEQNVLHPHNIFLAFWVETGLLGIVSFVGFVATSLIIALKEGFVEQKILTAAVIATLVFGMFDTPFFKNDLSVLFLVCMVLSVINLKE